MPHHKAYLLITAVQLLLMAKRKPRPKQKLIYSKIKKQEHPVWMRGALVYIKGLGNPFGFWSFCGND